MKFTRRNIVIFSLSLAMICAVTFRARFIKYINITAFKIIAQVFINLLNGLIALIAMKLTDMKINIDLKNKRQYLIGTVIALILSVVIAIIPALCGFSLIGSHTDPSWFVFTYDLLFYLLIIGPVEEFIFRVYLQDTFVSLFEKNRWIGVVAYHQRKYNSGTIYIRHRTCIWFCKIQNKRLRLYRRRLGTRLI